MPAFDYKCQNCGKVFEVYVATLSAVKNTTCTTCGSENTSKQFSVPNMRANTRESLGDSHSDECVSCCNNGRCGH